MENNRFISNDIFLGIFLAIFGIIFTIQATNFPAESSYLPILSGALLTAFSIVVLSFGISKTVKVRQGKADYTKQEIKKLPFIVWLTILVYVFAVDKIGFFVSSAVFLPLESMLFKQRKVLPIALTTVIILGFLYWMFVIQLKVSMHNGILF